MQYGQATPPLMAEPCMKGMPSTLTITATGPYSGAHSAAAGLYLLRDVQGKPFLEKHV